MRPITALIYSSLAVCLSVAHTPVQEKPQPFDVAQGAQTGVDGQEKPADKKEEPKKKHDLPLKTERTIEFDTDEATWLSLDVTPDGEAIIFELAGDLYRVPMAGGTAARITDGLPFDAQPRVSPDGKRLAFISDRNGSDNLWIAKIDGTEPRKLSNESQQAVISPVWTPDSQYVIASVRATGGTQLRMFHVDGGSGITLGAPSAPEGGRGGGPAPAASPNRLGATLSPDGRYLYAAQSSGGGGGGLPGWQIARLDMKTGDVDVITQAAGRAFRPLVSPDGNWLVYASRHETQTGLRVRDLSTGADRRLVWPVQRDEIESGGSPSRDLFPGYAFTPDSKAILTTKDGKIQKVDIATGQMTVIPFTANVQLEVGPDLEFPYRIEQGPVRARLIQDPKQSPDGKRLAMSVLTKIYVRDLPSGQPRRLTNGDNWEFKPTWSPDGQSIAYVTWSMNEGGHVWKTRADGSGQPQRLTSVPAFYTDITFSPDGTRIVGLRGNEFMRHQTFSEFGGLRIPLDLVWLPATGGTVETVVPARGVGFPHFTAEADRIYVYSNAGLISLRYDGTDRRTHLRVTGPARPGGGTPPAANAVLMRPDGKWALAAVNNQLWVVAVPPFTGSAASVSVRGPSVPVRRITDIGADYFAWADEGKTITWAIGSTYFRRAFDTLTFGPEPEAGRSGGAGGANATTPAPSTPTTGATQSTPPATPKDPLDLDKNVEAIDVVLEFPRAKPTGTIALRGGTVITMKGDEVLRNADIIVTDNRITSIGRRGAARIPAGAKIMDVSGKYIVPGFIDTHAHWEFRTHDVLEPQNWSLIANLAYGVTAGLDVQTSTNDYFAYQDLVDTGQAVGQRAFMTGPGVFSANDFQSYDATLAYLKRYKQHYRTINIKSYMVGNRKQRQWVVQAAKELGLMPTTEGGRDQKLDTTHAIDGMHGNEHTLPVVPLFKDTVEIFAQTKTAYTPTLLVQYGGPIAEHYFYTTMEVHDDPKLQRFYPHNVLDDMTRRRGTWVRMDEYSFDEAAAQAAKIQRAGGLIGVGGHGQLQGLGYHWEMWALAMGGMTPREVLKAATIDGARIIGFDQDLGSLETGKLADLVVLDRNPLENIRHTNTVRWVMKNGELYEADTLRQVWPVERTLPKFWWTEQK